MKKMLLVVALFSLAFVMNAQIEKGTWMLGGTAAYSTTHEGVIHNSIIDVSPKAGYFLAKNLAVGISVNVNRTIDDGDSTTAMVFGPYARYYFYATNEHIKLFANANAYLGSEDEGAGKSALNGFGAALGANYFFTKNIAMEASLGYYSTHAKIESVKDNTIGFNLGFQLFFGK